MQLKLMTNVIWRQLQRSFISLSTLLTNMINSPHGVELNYYSYSDIVLNLIIIELSDTKLKLNGT